MGPPPDDLFATPERHFLAFDGDEALFLRMDRAAYHRSIFLDRRTEALEAQPTRVALAPLVEAARDKEIPRTGWIFHVAHCGSTLLSRLIDRPDSGLVLREPPPLRQLGMAAASGQAGDAWHGWLHFASAMAARRFDESQPTVVKANVPVNFILPQLLARDPDAPSVLLYFALEPYLIAVLGSPGHRAWVDRLTEQLAAALAVGVGLASDAGTAERAAALWLAQMTIFDAALREYPATRSLDAETLFADPAGVAETAAAHFGLRLSATDGADACLMSTYSKDPARRFDESDRRAQQADRREALREDIVTARRWVETSPAVRDLSICLDRPIAGKPATLLA
ncbi:MAG: hypothetical protein ACR2FK_00430 [Sphingomicrobium sp.]